MIDIRNMKNKTVNFCLCFRKGMVLLLIIASGCSNNRQPEISLKQAIDFFPQDRTKVLVVGMFHLDYPGLDAKKTKDEHKIDILIEPKRTELSELVDYIKKFNPNKVAIEALPSWDAKGKLVQYLDGEYKNSRDERFQVGMRLVKELNLSSIFSIDAESLSEELARSNVAYLDSIFMSLNEIEDDGNGHYLKAWDDYSDQIVSKTNLLEYIKFINTEEYHNFSFGRYLLKDFKYEDQRGADLLSIWWYNRNLRIFRKIQEITENSNDRIVVVIGNAHAAILRSLIQASPEFEYIEFVNI